jgi:hypothetical protein
MTTTTIANRVISYFFIFDFYHGKGSTDEVDLLPESIIYFYSPKEDLKRQVKCVKKKNQMLYI